MYACLGDNAADCSGAIRLFHYLVSFCFVFDETLVGFWPYARARRGSAPPTTEKPLKMPKEKSPKQSRASELRALEWGPHRVASQRA